mmetsp:Transcript_32216/g.67759  ORF Transcript_32216/g.67759 Transcript_32216/m.67759 type:complete len:273 (+) Transcript_32216:200-1018(+)
MPRCDTCCSYPNGYITIAPCLLSIIAFILTSISTFSCHYAETQTSFGVGLLYRETSDSFFSTNYGDDNWETISDGSGNGYCTPYTSYRQKLILDTKMKSAQGFGLTAWMVGFIMVVVVWSISPCVASSRAGWRIVGAMFFLIGFFQALTLLILSSNVCSAGCSLKEGGLVAIFAFLFWWATAAICCMVPDAKDPNGAQSTMPPRAVAEATPVHLEMPVTVMATETTTQRVEHDGTIITEKITTNPDGSTTVTTSIIPPAAAAASLDANFEKA